MLLASRAGVQARTLDLATHGVTPHPKRATSTASPLPHSSLSFYFFTFGDMPGKAHLTRLSVPLVIAYVLITEPCQKLELQ